MIGIVFIGVMTALAVFAILAKTCAGGPKKAEKWEKGEIIKQLLALSDGENSSAAIASPPARSRSAPLQPDVLTRCERARLGSAIRSEGTPPSVPSPLFHSYARSRVLSSISASRRFGLREIRGLQLMAHGRRFELRYRDVHCAHVSLTVLRARG